MAPEEEEVTLIVESYDLTSAELGLGRKEGAEEPADGMTEKGGEVIQDEFG